MSRGAWLAALATGIVIACGSGYGDEATPAPASDAGASDAALVESRTEASVEAGALGYCASLSPKPTFCSDFDDGVLPGPWTKVLEFGNGTLRTDRDGVTSPPFAGWMRVNANAESHGASVVMETLPAPKERMRIAYDLRVDEFPNVGDADCDVMFVTFGHDAAAAFEIQTQLNANGTVELHSQGGAGSATDPPVVLPGGTFTRVEVDIDFARARATMSFNGAVTGPGIPFTSAPTVPLLYLGDPFIAGTTGSWSVRIDNVVVRID